MKPTLLITGGTGYLAQHLPGQAKNWNIHATYFRTQPPSESSTNFHQCNLTDSAQVQSLITLLKPEVIIHTACSNKSLEEIESIVPAAHNLVTSLKPYPTHLIHLSTDLVFDGTGAPYREEHLPQPINAYGEAKAKAEQIISTMGTKAAIVRSSLMYGFTPVDHQTRWLVRGLKTCEPIKLFTDEIRSPIWATNLAQALLELAETEYHGILHLAGPQALNRWDFGLAVLKLLKKKPTPNFMQSTIEESGMIRPKDLTFNSDKARQVVRTKILSISEVSEQLQ